jgi:hypothetical protein
MADENEEFAFRARLEREQASPRRTPRQMTRTDIARQFTEESKKKESEQAYNVGGAVTDFGAQAGLPPTVSAGLGTGANFLTNAVPGLFGGQITGQTVKPIANMLSKELMYSALKPSSVNASVAENFAKVKTMLEGGYNVTAGGVEKMKGRVGALEDEIRNLVKASPETVSLADVAKESKGVRESFLLDKDQKTVDRIFDEMKRKYFPKGMSMEEAHALKQRIYKSVKDKAFSGELQSAEKESLMGVARGIRGKEITVPGVEARLAEQSRLLEVLEPAEKRAIAELRNNPAGLSLLAHNPKLMALYIGDRSSAFKSVLANLINQSAVSPLVGTAGTISLQELNR